MKKFLAWTLVVLMLVGMLASCNNSEGEVTDTNAPDTSTQDTSKDTEPDEDDKKEPWKPPVLPPEDEEGEEGGEEAEKILTAPTALPNGTAITEIVSIADGTYTKPFDQKFGIWATGIEDKTTCIFDNGATVDTSEYAGFLVKKTPTTEGAGIYIRFKIKMSDDTEIEIKSANRPLYWYTTDGWEEVAGATSNWKLPIGEEGYALLLFPLSEITALGSAVIKDIQIYNSEVNRAAIFSEWSFVKVAVTDQGGTEEPETPSVPEGPTLPELAAPTTFKDGSKITITPISDGTWTKPASASAGCWATEISDQTTSIFANGATVDLAQYDGILVRKTPNTEGGGIYLRFKFKMADGTIIEVKSADRPLDWYDADGWGVVNGAASNWKLPIDKDGYFFFPLPINEITAHGSTTISDFYIYSSSNDRSAIFSSWSFVKLTAEGGAQQNTAALDAPAFNGVNTAAVAYDDCKIKAAFIGTSKKFI